MSARKCENEVKMNPNAWLDQVAPRLHELWRGRWKRATVEPARYLCDHELVIVSEGSCRLQVDETFHELTAGSFFIVPPGRRHVTTAGGEGVHRSCVHFDWTFPPGSRPPARSWTYFPGRFRKGEIRATPAFVPRQIAGGSFDASGPVPSLVESLFHGWQTGHDLDRALGRRIFGQLLLHLLWTRRRAAPLLDRPARLAYAVKALLDRPEDADAPVQELLHSLGFSYAHLARLFKKRFGISPLRYRNAARLERAKHLLQDPKRTIAAAAYEAGFHDPAYFSRRFRQLHGVAPKYTRS